MKSPILNNMKKDTVTATFPGIGKVEISMERAEQIKRLQKMIRENDVKQNQEENQ
jgi:hypothetical protein